MESTATTTTPSGVQAYRAVLAEPRLRRLMVVALFTRVPATATAVTLTLHVVLAQHLGYAAAGLMVAASTVGLGIGAPLMGRLVDRRGLRTMLAVTGAAAGVFWALAPALPYPALLGGAVLGGLLATPVHAVIRQSVGLLAPPALRRTAYAVDAMAVDVSYVVGPALGATLALGLPGPWPMWVVGTAWVLSGAALWWLDPPTRGEPTPDDPPTGGAGTWLGPALAAALLAAAASVFVVIGTELVMIAGLQRSAQTGMIPLVNTVWCVASITGGFAFGALRRSLPLGGLVGALGLITLPLAAAGPWWSFALLLVPAGLLVAPSLAASAAAVSALAPGHARGLAMGLHTSGLTVGGALATSGAGVMIDRWSPSVAVLVVGAIGVVAAGAVALLGRAGPTVRGRRAGPTVAASPDSTVAASFDPTVAASFDPTVAASPGPASRSEPTGAPPVAPSARSQPARGTLGDERKPGVRPSSECVSPVSELASEPLTQRVRAAPTEPGGRRSPEQAEQTGVDRHSEGVR